MDLKGKFSLNMAGKASLLGSGVLALALVLSGIWIDHAAISASIDEPQLSALRSAYVPMALLLLGIGILAITVLNRALFQPLRKIGAVLTAEPGAMPAPRGGDSGDDVEKARFLAETSREIRIPMNSVIGMIELLAQEPLPRNQRDMVAAGRTAAQTVLRILDDILDLSKLESGEFVFEHKPINLAHLTESTVTSLLPYAQLKKVLLDLEIDPSLDAPIYGDSTRFRLVLANLLAHSIRCTGTTKDREGRIAIHIGLHAAGADTALVYSIKHNGISFSAEDQARIFEPHTVAEAATPQSFHTGIGLPLAARIIKLRGGRIDIQNEQGYGTEVSVSIPVARVETATVLEYGMRLDGLRVAVATATLEEQTYLSAWLHHFGALTCSYGEMDTLQNDLRKYDHGFAAVVFGSDWAENARLPEIAGTGLTADRDPPHAIVLMDSAACLSRAHGITFLGCRPLFPSQLAEAVVQATRTDVAVAAANHQGAPGRVDRGANTAGRILIVEDDETNQDVIQRQLVRLGYAFDVAGDGLEAILMWRQNRYGILLADLHMPDCDGYQMTRIIRRFEANHSVKTVIIAVTANAIRGEADKALALGLDDYLTKPVELAMLKQSLDKWAAAGARRQEYTAGQLPPMRGDMDHAGPPCPTRIDRGVLADLLGEHTALQQALLEKFISNSTAVIRRIESALHARDTATIASNTGSLKTAARTIGASEMAFACMKLEHAVTSDDWDEVRFLVSQLNESLLQLEETVFSTAEPMP